MVTAIAFNLALGGGSHAMICSVHKAGVANILPLKATNQHYTAFIEIYDAIRD